ncbi:helix-turn-helix domain-containing protein [Nocardioides zeae]|uniref:Transcriptional regulator with XRE-family HTH domain n=1 Tax=Nocardioides zeae TaxID=1457234 RepID=A0AAJ1U1P0_9ACTN|nr:helix-turn-helix transcriptional regulator [Nocardioides zeae]MDQ1102866.1 transcriptional regulator with XRE-family HTH domain [Nocardioides zeae]
MALRQLREEAGFTQRQLAIEAQMAQPAVARLEACETIPTLATLTRLSKALGCDFSILIGGE